MNNKYPTTKPSLNLDFANTKSLDPRITFRRGTPGTYYDGVTHAKAEENLIHYSEDFANAYWRVNQITITTGHSSPDGGSTARKLAPTSGTSNKFIEIESGGSQNDFPDLGNLHFAASVFAKAGEKKYIKFATVDTNLTRRNDVIVDLSDGSIIESINNDETQYSVESAGGDWYRIGITGFGMQQLQVLVLGDDLSTNAAGDGTSGIYLWGAQLEQRDTVTSYTATNGAPITKYQPKLMTAAADHARFDHDPITGESKGLLIEESRTNLIEYSEDFSEWTETGSIDVDHQGTVGLDASSFAAKITRKQTGTTGDQNINITKALGNTNKHSISLYVKPVSDCDLVLNTGSYAARFDFSSLTVTDLKNAGLFDGGQIEELGNGWYRCSANGTGESSSVQYQIIPWIGSVGGDWSNDRYHDGDSVSGLYIWGAQLEEGSFPTSYIKTTGASATRSADNASITGENFSSWYRQDEGSIYCEATKKDVPSTVAPVSVDGGTSDYILLNLRSTDSFEIKKNNVYQVSSLGFPGVTSGTYHKIMGTYKKDSAAVSINGLSALNDSTCEIPTVNRLTIGSTSGVAQNVHIKKISYYPQRLTNEQLQNLTK